MSWEIYANTKCSKEMKFVKTDDGKGQGEGWHGEWVLRSNWVNRCECMYLSIIYNSHK